MIDSQLSVDPYTRHIVGAIIFNGTGSIEKKPSITLATVSDISPVSKVKCHVYYLDTEQTAKLPKDITEGNRKYLYVDDTVYRCPKIFLSTPGYDCKRLPLNVDIDVVAIYEESRGVSFLNGIEELKFKDRYEFIDVPKRIKFDKELGVGRVTIRSSYPGVSLLRAKDTGYLCFFDPLEIRFRQ